MPLDTEIERTLRGLRKVKSAEIEEMEDERVTQAVNQEFTAEVPQERDTMEDFWRPVIQDEYSAVRQPAIDANNFELKPALITMVQQNQFTGHPTEDPNEHLGRFLKKELDRKRARQTMAVGARLEGFVDWSGVLSSKSIEEKEMSMLTA